jgi:hypothetical protein
MTKLSLDWDAPDRRIGRATKAYQFAWGAFCGSLASSAVTVATTAFLRLNHLM